ncbi:unnamed protein product, partial [Musa acuminata subsp. burmannicoides]
SGPFAPDAAGELDILGHYSHPLGVDGAEIGILEETHEICFGGLLQRRHRRALETQVGLEVLGDLTDQTLEWQLPDEQLRALLVLSDLPQSDRSGAEAMWLLHAASRRGRLPRRLRRQLLPRGLPAGGLPGRLLRTRHRRGL